MFFFFPFSPRHFFLVFLSFFSFFFFLFLSFSFSFSFHFSFSFSFLFSLSSSSFSSSTSSSSSSSSSSSTSAETVFHHEQFLKILKKLESHRRTEKDDDDDDRQHFHEEEFPATSGINYTKAIQRKSCFQQRTSKQVSEQVTVCAKEQMRLMSAIVNNEVLIQARQVSKKPELAKE